MIDSRGQVNLKHQAFKDNGMMNKPIRIYLQPWLWVAGTILLIAVSLAGIAARYLWQDVAVVHGQVRHMGSGEPIAGAYVEVAWSAVDGNNESRPLHHSIVRTDTDGHYAAALPERILTDFYAQPRVRGESPARIAAYTTRAYKPGYRHLHTSLSFHQRVSQLSTQWNSMQGIGFTLEVDEPSARDRAGDVRLVPVAAPDHQRVRQLYGAFRELSVHLLSAEAETTPGWLQAMCREADHLRLDGEFELLMREEICNARERRPLSVQTFSEIRPLNVYVQFEPEAAADEPRSL
jgi:hypothetical protein